jgi:hypothetical protein
LIEAGVGKSLPWDGDCQKINIPASGNISRNQTTSSETSDLFFLVVVLSLNPWENSAPQVAGVE